MVPWCKVLRLMGGSYRRRCDRSQLMNGVYKVERNDDGARPRVKNDSMRHSL